MVTHHLEGLPGGTSHAVLLSDGRVVGSRPVDTVLTTENVTAAFAHPTRVAHHEGRWLAQAEHRR